MENGAGQFAGGETLKHADTSLVARISRIGSAQKNLYARRARRREANGQRWSSRSIT